jgi:sulfite exporter TauE/SafE
MDALIAHCAGLFSSEKGIFLTFFIGGLTGGFTHCLAMCGPYVVCEGLCKSKSCTKRQVSGWKYHLGRLTTYGLLGFLVALLSKQVAAASWWPALSSFMLAGAGILFLLSFLKTCHHRPSSKLSYWQGLLLGFMPCGLLYAALMMAATLANPIMGMLAMWIFTLGTIPALILASGSATLLSRKWQHIMQIVGRAMMAFNGLSLLMMAARIMR